MEAQHPLQDPSSKSSMQRPTTSLQRSKPLLIDDEHVPSRNVPLDSDMLRAQSATHPHRSSPANITEPLSQRLGRSLLTDNHWSRSTVADVHLNAKVIEQSDQNILFGQGKTVKDTDNRAVFH